MQRLTVEEIKKIYFMNRGGSSNKAIARAVGISSDYVTTALLLIKKNWGPHLPHNRKTAYVKAVQQIKIQLMREAREMKHQIKAGKSNNVVTEVREVEKEGIKIVREEVDENYIELEKATKQFVQSVSNYVTRATEEVKKDLLKTEAKLQALEDINRALGKTLTDSSFIGTLRKHFGEEQSQQS